MRYIIILKVVVVVGGWILYRQTVLASFHSLKTMDRGPLRGLGPLFSRNGAILGHSLIQKHRPFEHLGSERIELEFVHSRSTFEHLV